MAGKKDKPSICSLKVEANGFTLIETVPDGLSLIGLHSGRTPALICAYDLNSIRLRMADTVIQIVAIRETANKHNYSFDMNNAESWKALSKDNSNTSSA